MKESTFSLNEALPSSAERAQHEQENYLPMEQIVEQSIARITGQEPHRWLTATYRCLRTLQEDAQSDRYPAAVREYIASQVEPLLDVLRGKCILPAGATPEEQLAAINEQARAVIHEMSDLLLIEQKAREPIPFRQQSLESILEQKLEHGFALRLAPSEEVEGIQTIEIYSPTRAQWFAFPLPPTATMVHKGGFPRVILKLLAGAPPETIESELPPNDFDVIAWGEESEAYRTASQIGVDLSGVEVLKGEPDFSRLMYERDLDLNSAFIGQQGLVYSEAALQAARTGHVEPIPSYRGLYGMNMLSYQGELLYKGRDMMRAIKFVAEGKALSFSFKELNKQIDMGIYVLVLAEKFMRKANRDELLDKMFCLLQQTGQVQEGEADIWAVLERIHQQYPFVQMEDRGLPSDTEVSAWLLGKLGKQALQRFRSEYRIPSLLALQRTEGDNVPHTVNLEGYHPDPSLGSPDYLEKLEAFLEHCALRNQTAQAAKTPPTP